MSVLKNFLIGLDQSVNCIVKLSDGWGWPDEMLSARAWRLRAQHPSLHLWIDRLFFWDADHCQECYVIEYERKQVPDGYEVLTTLLDKAQNTDELFITTRASTSHVASAINRISTKRGV